MLVHIYFQVSQGHNPKQIYLILVKMVQNVTICVKHLLMAVGEQLEGFNQQHVFSVAVYENSWKL